jgi:adenine-specific DNA-methyltransferase
MTKSQLVQKCKELNIPKYTLKKKCELISMIEQKYVYFEKDNDNDEHNKDVNEYTDNETNDIVNQQVQPLVKTDTKMEYVLQTMLTCIGNKRKLVTNISQIINEISIILDKPKLNMVDGFSGSSVVSRELSYLSDNLYVNDLEYYSYLMAHCYLVVPSECQKERINCHIRQMNHIALNGPYTEGIICKLYSPKDTYCIKEGERCFYTRENALIIDSLRNYISHNVEDDISVYCLVPLLNKASIHTNTAGVFKGFYKNENIGCFGGKGEFALSRIMKPILLDIPIWNESSDYKCFPTNKDINILIDELPDNIDVIYLDPPYNQHPYGSNYFMLNVIATNEEPSAISKVSGIPINWNKSNYNSYKTAIESMKHLINNSLLKSKYILISYNNEGIIKLPDWEILFAPYQIKKYEIKYDTYKGCRNLKDRSNKVVEIMYLVSKF